MFPNEKQICERKYKKQIIWIGLRKYLLGHLQDKDLSDNRRWREVFKDRGERLCKRKELISHRKLKAGQSDLAMGRKREIAEARQGRTTQDFGQMLVKYTCMPNTMGGCQQFFIKVVT